MWMLNLLPWDIFTYILSKLPVKSLLRFRCVSKSWFSLIGDPNFVKLHHNHATQNNNIKLILSRLSKFYSVDNNTSFAQALEIDYPDNSPHNWVKISGSCNGLLCIHTNRINAIWNPSTKEFKKLPATRNSVKLLEEEEGKVNSTILFGFGYDSTVDDYKVVRIVQYYDLNVEEYFEAEVKVYTLGTDSWRRVDNVDFCFFSEEYAGLFVDGTVNWLATTVSVDNEQELIVSFNVMDEKFREIPSPKFVDRIVCLGILGGNLCLLDEFSTSQADIWVMKEYGVEESWAKLFTIPQLTGIPVHTFLRVLCFANTGEVLLLNDYKDLLLYNPKLKKTEILSTSGIPELFRAVPYVESLVSLKSGTYVGGKQAKRKTRNIGGKKRKMLLWNGDEHRNQER